MALSLGLLAVTYLQNKYFANQSRVKIKSVKSLVYSSDGIGSSGADYGPDDPRNFQNNTLESSNSKIVPIKNVKIISKPRAFYPDKLIFNESRLKQYQGKKVVLRVTFTANRQIGVISIITGLPEGLTEQAITAARNIKFEPATRNGTPISVTKLVEYTFTIY